MFFAIIVVFRLYFIYYGDHVQINIYIKKIMLGGEKNYIQKIRI